MAKKHQLLTEAAERERRNIKRAGYEREIVRFLPHNLEVSRVYIAPSHTQSDSNCQGRIDIDVLDYPEAVGVTQKLPPAPLSTMLSGKAVSFCPTELIDMRRRESHPIYPILFQMTNETGNSKAMVYLEWFVKVRQGIFANVRVRIKHHPCHYSLVSEGYKEKGLPRWTEGYRRVMAASPSSVPTITIWWDETCFNDEFTLKDLLMEGVEHA